MLHLVRRVSVASAAVAVALNSASPAHADAEPDPVVVGLREGCEVTVYPPYVEDPLGNPTVYTGRVTFPEDPGVCGERP